MPTRLRGHGGHLTNFASQRLISEARTLVSPAVTSTSKGNADRGGTVDTTVGASASTGPAGSVRAGFSRAGPGATRAKGAEGSQEPDVGPRPG